MFHVKNDFVLIKYKIKSSKPHSFLLLTLSPFSPNTLSVSIGMTSVYGTLLWTLWLLFVKHFCVTCYICLTCIIVCGTFCLLSICHGFFFFYCLVNICITFFVTQVLYFFYTYCHIVVVIKHKLIIDHDILKKILA